MNKLPKFVGGADPEVYLDWERKIDIIFGSKELEDNKCCNYAVQKLIRGASLWYEGMNTRRARAGKGYITSWTSLKHKL